MKLFEGLAAVIGLVKGESSREEVVNLKKGKVEISAKQKGTPSPEHDTEEGAHRKKKVLGRGTIEGEESET